MAQYTQAEAEAKRDEILKGGRDVYDNVKIVADRPGDPGSPKRVLARKHDDHTQWVEQ